MAGLQYLLIVFLPCHEFFPCSKRACSSHFTDAVAPSISPLEVSATVAEGAHREQPDTAANPAEARERRRRGTDPRQVE